MGYRGPPGLASTDHSCKMAHLRTKQDALGCHGQGSLSPGKAALREKKAFLPALRSV